MWNNIGNTIVIAVLAIMLAFNGASLETALLIAFMAGCFYTLGDIRHTLRNIEERYNRCTQNLNH